MPVSLVWLGLLRETTKYNKCFKEATLHKCQESHPLQMPCLPGSPAEAPPVLASYLCTGCLSLCRGDRGCFKNHFAGVKYSTAFFADCQDAQNRSQHRHVVTPPAVGRQARCGPEAIYWQQKGRTALEGGSSMPATLGAQTSHPALSTQPGSSPDLELFGAPCDDYIEVHSSSAVQITTGW